MRIELEPQKNLLSTRAAETVNRLFDDNKDKSILFLTSGGASFDILQHLKIPDELNLSIGVLDERYSTDLAVNNFAQLTETDFFKNNKDVFKNILDTTVREESLEEFTERYESMLRTWMVENPGGIIIATIGMGPDGHVTGMMPFPEDDQQFERLFNDGHHLVVGYDTGDKNPYKKRATTTMEFMRKIHHGIAYITGDSKREAWNRVVVSEGSLAQTPARIMRDMEDVTVFTDLG